MRRRSFITLLGGAAAWPLAARAQRPAMPMIGFLHQGSPEANTHIIDAFRRGLQETGYVEGRNVVFEFHWANGEYDRLPDLAADLVRRQPSIIAAALLPAARAAKAATSTIPIVFVSGSDPIEAGLVTSLSRPTGNVTGVSLFSVPLTAKRLELLHELVPGAAAVAVLVNPTNPNADASMREIEVAGRRAGLHIAFVKISGDKDFDAAFSTMSQQRAGVLIVSADGFFASRRRQLVGLAARLAVPAIYFQREFVEAGGLMSYGASSRDRYRHAGIYAGKILGGTKPTELPIEQPTKLELVINLQTARALAFEIPPMLLARADEVIE
jgi:putative ABC transport system substrate-binding protein